jgi:DNA-binding Lrp family transcriptional regulator
MEPGGFDNARWTTQDRAIAKLLEIGAPRDISTAAIAKRYGMEASSAQDAIERVERLVHIRRQRAAMPKPITAAKVGALHQEAVRAVLEHAERLVVYLPADVANHYHSALREDALHKAEDCLSRVLTRLQAYQPSPGGLPQHAWEESLVKHGYRYLRTAVVNFMLDEHVRLPLRQKRLQGMAVEGCTANSGNALESYLRDHEPKLSWLWDIFGGFCNGATAQTRDALLQTARDFGYRDVVGETLFFDSYLRKTALPGAPDRPWIKAFLGVHLATLNPNGVDQRVFRLRPLWRRVIARFQRLLQSAA